jgi:hypothetical protein
VPGAGVAQVPVPEQNGCAVNIVPAVVPEQVGPLHMTEALACWQAPAPLQAPVLPQVVLTAHWPAGAAIPVGIGEQLPRPLTLQAWQVPQAELPQQTPSVQKPLMHWLAVLQACPLGLSAQLLLVPAPWQVSGATQSRSAVQVVLHTLLVVSQLKPPAQVEEVGAAQLPLPLQWEIGVKVDPLQLWVPQEVAVPASWHAPAPLQAPVLPQGGLVAHRPCGSSALAATGAQLPALPPTLQAWQVPHELELQQTPSTQLSLVWQSPVTAQACPSRFLVPQMLMTGSQMLGAWQSASTEQAALQAVVPLHTYGKQPIVVAGWQVPLPSQVRPEVRVALPAAQTGAAHEVPPAYRRQAPFPSQNPSVPQLALPAS